MEREMSYGKNYRFMPLTSIRGGKGEEVVPDLYCQTIQIVNIGFVGDPVRGDWVLIDAGMPHSAVSILEAAEERFGSRRPPKAIFLTHGHFDHVGAVIELIKHWNVPVFAHEAEIPYLTGVEGYSPPDPSVSAGLVAKLSVWFPNEPVDLGRHVQPLPADNSVPFLPEWRWIHTPGHTPGHVSFFRERDRSLIAGDAFSTVKQESVYKVITQEREISGPPKYFTTDWQAARDSVAKLEALKPTAAIAGHGMPMKGEELAESLKRLVRDFDRIALPQHGQYIMH